MDKIVKDGVASACFDAANANAFSITPSGWNNLDGDGDGDDDDDDDFDFDDDDDYGDDDDDLVGQPNAKSTTKPANAGALNGVQATVPVQAPINPVGNALALGGSASGFSTPGRPPSTARSRPAVDG